MDSKDESEADVAMEESKTEDSKPEQPETSPVEMVPAPDEKAKQSSSTQENKAMLSLDDRMTQFKDMLLERGVRQHMSCTLSYHWILLSACTSVIKSVLCILVQLRDLHYHSLSWRKTFLDSPYQHCNTHVLVVWHSPFIHQCRVPQSLITLIPDEWNSSSWLMIQQAAWVWTNRNQGRLSGFQLYNAGVLVENPSHIQKQTGRKVST